MNTNCYIPKTRRKTFRVAAYFLSFLAAFSPVLPTLANTLPDYLIEDDLNSTPVFQKVNTPSVQYQTPSFIEAATIGGEHIESFEKTLLSESRSTLGDPTYVPIGVGGITTIIPIYPNHKLIGTRAVQSRYVRTQIEAILGKSLIDASISSYANETNQLNKLYANALSYAKNNTDKFFGDRLDLNQDASGGLSVPENMIWPELREINGEEVLVPIVYLSESTVETQKVDEDENQFAGNVTASSLTVRNSNVTFLRDALLNVAGDITVVSGSLAGKESLEIQAGGTFSNLSGTIEALEGNLIIGAANIYNGTVVYRYDTGQMQGTRYGSIASIEAGGDVVLRSYSDIVFQAGTAGGQNLTLAADGNISLGTQQLFSGGESRYGSGVKIWSAVSFLQSKLTAEDTIKLVASGAIEIDAAEIVAGGHIEILAGLGITVLDEMEQYQMQAKGKFGKREVNESIYQTVAIRALLDAGKGIKLSTDFGDIAIRAADISSLAGTSVSAKNGTVNLLMTTETDHYSYSSIKEGLFTTKTISKGNNFETGVPNSIVGGFSVEALNGINVEYEGDPDLSLEGQVRQLASMDEGLSWMVDVMEADKAQWQEIVMQYEEWDTSSTSLSPAFAAVIAIAVACVAGPAGAAVAESAAAAGVISTASGAMGAAIAAGTTSLISQATLAAANGAVNGDIGGAMEDFASSDTFKSLAVAMVTAGAIAKVDAAFFNVDQASVVEASNAVEGAATAAQIQSGVDGAVNATNAVSNGMSLTAQVGQAVTHAAVQAGAQSIILGADFEDSFVQSLVSNSLSIIGEKLANEIGTAKSGGNINTATQLVAHAAVGCLTGGITAAVDGNDGESGCVSGGGGAVIGELIGLAYTNNLEEDLDSWIKEELAEGNVIDQDAVMAQAMEFKRLGVDMAKLGAALTAFATGGDVNIAANAGQNAAENNAFFLIAVVAVAAYTSYVSYKEGGLYEGLQAIGRGDDPLAQAITSVAEAGIELAAEHYPEETQKAAQVLMAAGEKISAGVKVVMETEAGETVTRYWNEIPEEDRNALIGAGSVVSMIIPAGVVTKLKTLSKIDVEPGEWIKDPNHANWKKVSNEDREILEREYEIGATDSSSSNPLLSDSIPRKSNRMVLDQGPTPTCGHNACAMTLDSLGNAVDPARLIERIPPTEAGINGVEVKRLFTQEGVPASFVGDRTVERLGVLTQNGRPVVVRIEGPDNFSHWVVVDGVTERAGVKVVAIRDSAGGKEYFSPVETFNESFTGEVVIPNP